MSLSLPLSLCFSLGLCLCLLEWPRGGGPFSLSIYTSAWFPARLSLSVSLFVCIVMCLLSLCVLLCLVLLLGIFTVCLRVSCLSLFESLTGGWRRLVSLALGHAATSLAAVSWRCCCCCSVSRLQQQLLLLLAPGLLFSSNRDNRRVGVSLGRQNESTSSSSSAP